MITTASMIGIIDALYDVDPSLTVNELSGILREIEIDFPEASLPFSLDMVDAYRSGRLYEYCKERIV